MQQPDEKREFSNIEAELWLGKQIEYEGKFLDADYFFVRYPTGEQFETLIFKPNGKRKICLIKQGLNFTTGAFTFVPPHFLDGPDEKKLLRLYDEFMKKSFPD